MEAEKRSGEVLLAVSEAGWLHMGVHIRVMRKDSGPGGAEQLAGLGPGHGEPGITECPRDFEFYFMKYPGRF